MPKIEDGEAAVTPETEPKLITAKELLGLIAQAGPGSRLGVRSYHLPDGTIKEGKTTWMSDFTKGPAVYYFDSDNEDWIAGVLALGGETHTITPPSHNSPLGDPRSIPFIKAGFTNWTHTKPIDPIAQERYRFELIPEADELDDEF